MFAQEPDLKFIRPDHIAHYQIISTVMTELGSATP